MAVIMVTHESQGLGDRVGLPDSLPGNKCFSFTPVPQTDLKVFNSKSSLSSRGSYRPLGSWKANGNSTCFLQKMQKDRSLMPLGIMKIQISRAKPAGFKPWSPWS